LIKYLGLLEGSHENAKRQVTQLRWFYN